MMAKDLKVYFVLPSHCEDELGTSEPMRQAFELCCQNQIIPDWISEVAATSNQFVKTDVIVFEKFQGSAFEKVRALKCLRLAGPWCLISCLLEGLQVPNNRSPVYTMAMNNLVVTASAYSQEKKIRIKEKVELMGGIFTLNVTNNLTHLVTDSVRTQKYEVVNSLNKPVMLDSWIAAVWKESCIRNVKATDDEFLKYKCPIFQNLRVCCTGFDPKNRNAIQEHVCKNGGRYSGKLVTSATDILICNPNSKSEKFEVAKKSKIPCVRKEWVFDSVEKGHCIPEKDYTINVSSSTPTKASNAAWNHDFSMMSMISVPENAANDTCKTSASETIDMSLYNMDATSHSRKSSISIQKENEIPDVIDSIDLQQVKKAGTFLDGCGVYLVGFSPNRREKMIRILKTAGATRYDEISDRVTQIVVGDPASNEMKALNAKGCGLPMVSVKWIVESMKRQEPAHEDAFAITCTKNTTAMPSSPLSKKGLTLLQNDTTLLGPPPVPKFDLGAEEEDPIQMYRNKTNEEDTLARLLMQSDVNSKLFRTNTESKPVETPKKIHETILSQEESEDDKDVLPIFEGKTFKIIDHTAEDVLTLAPQIESLAGQIVPSTFRAVTDYVIVPTTCNAVKHAATEVVNTLYVPNCLQENQKLTIEYYHQPIYDIYNNKPLTGCVITLSGFIYFERTFLVRLIQHLGALYQDKLARVTTPASNVLGSTHLICSEPTGSKYSAAVRWNIPVLRREWILKCLATGTKYEESGVFAFGASIADTNPPPKMSLSINKIENQNKQQTTENQNKPQTTENKAQNIKNERVSVAKNVTPHKQENLTAKRKSPVETKDETTNEEQNDHDTSQTKKLKADETDFANAPLSQDDYFNETFIPENLKNLDVMDQPGSPVIVVEGRAVPLKTYMKELRDQGLFDTPSPARKLEGTPHEEIIARLRKKVPVKNAGRPALKSCDSGGSQGTPVGRYLRSLQERNVLPKSPKSGPSRNSFGTPDNSYLHIGEVKTPDTPLGRFLGEDEPSRETRKHWQKYVDQIPVYNCHNRPPVSHPRRPSTPFSEVKKQAWSWLLRDKGEKEDGGEKKPNEPSTSKNVEKDVAPEETESQQQVTNQIGQLQDMFKKRNNSTNGRSSLLKLDGTPQKQNYDGSSKIAFHDAKNSQADTVGWDEPIENVFDGQVTETSTDFRHRKFMMSALDAAQKASISNTIKSLGGEVSDNPQQYDDSATHVICMNPTRNEKVLSAMASGKWVVHPDFVQKSGEQGRFLSEELYEFGNPLAVSNLSSVTTTPVTEAIHWWRKRFEKTKKGAFSHMRALIFAKNRPAVVRLIQAGQGVVVQAEPPFDHSLDVTHCFIDLKMKIDFTQFIPLTEQGILCLSILYLSNYLNNVTNVDTKDYIISELRGYYK